MEGNSMFTTLAESTINGQKVWKHLLSTPIGNIYVVQYEVKTEHNILTFLFEEDLGAAERKYKQLIRGITSGKL